jgi:hypothetical protein
MNCKPNQLAWIVVPKEQAQRGIEQLNRRVVRTIALQPGFREPVWEVMPRMAVTITQDCVDPNGEVLRAGDTAVADGIPDAYLRPFDPNSEPEQAPEQRELVTLA